MKNSLILVFTLLICSITHSESFVTFSHSTLEGMSLDRYAINYNSVEDNTSWSGGVDLVDSDTVTSSLILSGDFGVQSFASGTVYWGIDISHSEHGDTEEDLSIGYSKRKLNELSYDVSIAKTEQGTLNTIMVRVPMTLGSGILYGLTDSDIGKQYSIGLSVDF